MSTKSHRTRRGTRPSPISRIAVGVDGYPEARDAVVLANAIGRVTSAELMLVGVHMDPLVVLPKGMDWSSLEEQFLAMLRETRDEFAPSARVEVRTDISVARALDHVAGREHRDLLVVGSSRHAPEGHVRIGKRTRSLLNHFRCPLAVAPRGLQDRAEVRLEQIGVGYDGGDEAEAALALASAIALASGATLHVVGVVDDRVHALGWTRVGSGAIGTADVGWEGVESGGGTPSWDALVERTEDALGARLEHAARTSGLHAEPTVTRGRPANALLDLAEHVDLLVVGSRRWGPIERVLLGSTGEALMHDAACPVLVVPRPHTGD